ncbi:MAG TPA: hypothetical protein VF680_01525 [Allosphingosinicella sp.]|jgi:hypothetical protein
MIEKLQERMLAAGGRLKINIRFAGSKDWQRVTLTGVDVVGVYLEDVHADGAHPWSSVGGVSIPNAGTAQVAPSR